MLPPPWPVVSKATVLTGLSSCSLKLAARRKGNEPTLGINLELYMLENKQLIGC